MPSGAGNPQKNPRRDNLATKSTSDQPPLDSMTLQETSKLSSPGSTEKRRRNSRRNPSGHIPRPTQGAVQDDSSAVSLTPPVQILQPDMATTQVRNSHPASVKSRGGNKKRMANAHAKDDPALSTTPNRKVSPPAGSRSNSMTPLGTTGTPTQAYAGPTFHASPAPSALPIPKFFSRSVPELNKGSLKAMMDGNISEESSDRDETSPTLKNAQHTSEHQARENSPLDIFFRADRDEKAKRRAGSFQTVDDVAEQNLALLATASQSASPIPDHVRHHSRHPTDSSTSGLFALEMGDADKPKASNDCSAAEKKPDVHRSYTAPPTTTQAGPTDEQRKVKTLALKQLLLSPLTQHSPKTTKPSHLTSQSAGTYSPSPSPSPRRVPLLRSNSGSSTPTAGLTSPNKLPILYNHHTSHTTPQQYLAATANGSSRTHPPSSLLRQEVVINKPRGSVETSELLSTPTRILSRPQDLFKPAMSQNNRNIELNRAISPFTTTHAPELRTGIKSHFNRDPSHVKLMEDDLRRLLKLEVLGSDGATGVRS
ncbi:hypothetical protein MMC24_004695 [Lignoscripta atroalba]|nr:hypothetical protein [Lignoscripta atroalba]